MTRFSIALLAFLFHSQAHAGIVEIGSTTRKYPEVKAFLQKLASEQSGNVSLFNIGPSDSKEEIIGVKIGAGPVHNLVVSAHHGNEYGSAELALAFAESLSKQPIPGQTIYIIPVLNISGYNSRTREERDSSGRSFDPNRNYPGPCGTEGPFTLKSTRALANLIEQEKITVSATLHSYYPAVVYPWGISSRDLDTSYTNEFRKIVMDATEESRYQIGNSSEVIYPADGTYEDYVFLKHGVWSILFELGNTHSPGDGAIQDMIRANVPGLRRMFENAPKVTAENHAFSGKCDTGLRALDRHDE